MFTRRKFTIFGCLIFLLFILVTPVLAGPIILAGHDADDHLGFEYIYAGLFNYIYANNLDLIFPTISIISPLNQSYNNATILVNISDNVLKSNPV